MKLNSRVYKILVFGVAPSLLPYCFVSVQPQIHVQLAKPGYNESQFARRSSLLSAVTPHGAHWAFCTLINNL